MGLLNSEFLRFLFVGVASNAINYTIYLFVYWIGAPLFAASSAGYVAGLLCSYHFARIWVFGIRFDIRKGSVFRFLAVYAVGGVVMCGLIEVLVRASVMNYQASWFVGAVFSMLNNFFGLQRLVFKKGHKQIMATPFSFLSKVEFLQEWASTLIAWISPAIVHNLGKYIALKKVHYLSTVEDVEGDYLEFGVFTGSSFCHSIRCYKKLANLNPKTINTKFYGFDSFSGFGTLAEDDKHSFYLDENFVTNLSAVNRRANRVAGDIKFQFIPGFFSESLKKGAKQFGIEKSRIIFIDSDTYTSANEALTFCIPTLQEGTFIVLDDYYSYRGSDKKGVRRAFLEFIALSNIKVRHVFAYGLGGAVYVVSERLA